MSRWDRGDWYRPTPKKPPPEHGIKVKKTGTTWWGQRWIEALEHMSLGYSNRLARGRTYARAGRTHDLVVKAGHVKAKVTGSRATPYKVTMQLTKLPDAAWKRAIEAMAAKAQFTAELLSGQMPKEIDEAFRVGGTSIFPKAEADLVTDCSCPDWANPCKHVAATHYVLGEALERDPFLLFELRGRTKGQVLDAAPRVRTTVQRRGRGAVVRRQRLQPPRSRFPRSPSANSSWPITTSSASRCPRCVFRSMRPWPMAPCSGSSAPPRHGSGRGRPQISSGLWSARLARRRAAWPSLNVKSRRPTALPARL